MTVLVLLSGGRDSVCLLARMAAERGPSRVVALHVNYGLRPEADADEAFCRDLCSSLGVELVVERAGEPPVTGNLQAWARDVRYAAAFALADARDIGEVAVGHTASDQIETVLYRLASSPGRRALLGMRRREGRVVRPLLGITRDQTAAWCREHGLAWREDASNDDTRFARNRLREALESVHPAVGENLLRTVEVLRDEAEVLDAIVDDALSDEVAVVSALPPALRRLVLERLAGAPVGRRADEILALGASGGSRSLDLGGGLRALVEYGRLRFDRDPAVSPEPVELVPPGRVPFGAGEVLAERGPELPVADGTLDAGALDPVLHVRAWRAGDRMRPLGLGGHRSLQDLFTDRKVPRERRHVLPVVVSAGEIAWVPGVATGERFRVTPATRERVRLQWRALA